MRLAAHLLLLPALTLACGAWAVVSAVHTAHAHRTLRLVQTQSHALQRELAEYLRLRTHADLVPPRGHADLASRVNAVAASSGIPPASIASILPEAEAAITAHGSRTLARHAARVSLQYITLAQLGRFLDAWRHVEPDWTASSIEFTPEPRTLPHEPVKIRSTIVVEAFLVEHSDHQRPTESP